MLACVPLLGLLLAPSQVEPIPLSAFLERNLFGARIGSDDPLPPPDERCRPIRLSAELVATLVGEKSAASFSTADGLVILRSGDAIEGATISEIDRGVVRVRKDGRCGVAQLGFRPAPRRSTPGPELQIRALSRDEVALKRREVEALLQDPTPVMREARIVPQMSGGQIRGFKIFRLRENGLAGRLGLENGDVLERINGHSLSDPGKLIGFHQELLAKDTLVLDFTRRGQRRTLTVRLE